jgi:hypothetical protein
MQGMKYIPYICELGAEFSGHVVLKKMTYPEKIDLEGMASQIKDGDAKAIKETVEFTKPFYLEVEVKNLVSGCEYKSFDDLYNDAEASEIINDVTAALMVGPAKKKIQNMSKIELIKSVDK